MEGGGGSCEERRKQERRRREKAQVHAGLKDFFIRTGFCDDG
jgi:hypothetical protein